MSAQCKPYDGQGYDRWDWQKHADVTCVECPGCGFTFDRDHSDADECIVPQQMALALRLLLADEVAS